VNVKKENDSNIAVMEIEREMNKASNNQLVKTGVQIKSLD
jgi:hypothetical protein